MPLRYMFTTHKSQTIPYGKEVFSEISHSRWLGIRQRLRLLTSLLKLG
jgi:hypothetical protein